MAFQLQNFFADRTNAAPAISSSFSDVSFTSFNKFGHNGKGSIVITLAGAEPRKTKSQLVVLADKEGDFRTFRRVFYIKSFDESATGGSSTPPDCQSIDGSVPDASSPHPQAATCADCPRAQKDTPRANKCAQRKSITLFAVGETDEGLVVDTSTPLVWDVSPTSLFPKMNPKTGAAGVIAMVKEVAKVWQGTGRVVEQAVFEVGFHDDDMNVPLLKAVGALPEAEVMEVIEAAQQPDVKALLSFNAERANKTPSLAAPTARAALPAPMVDTAKAAATAAVTRARPAPRPAPPVEVPEEELYVAPTPAPAPVAAPTPSPFVPEETDEEREEREMEEALARKKAARLAAANQPAAARVVESTATVRTLPAAVAPPVAPAPPAAAPVAATASTPARGAAFAAFNAARK